jgi:hypothetical protein
MVKLVVLLLAIISFYFGYTNPKRGIYLIVFFIPYESNMEVYGFELSILLIIVFFIAFTLNPQVKFKRIPYKLYIIFFLTLILIGFIYFGINGFPSSLYIETGITANSAVTSFIKDIIAAFLLYVIINNVVDSYTMVRKVVKVFVFSISYFFITWLFSYLLKYNLPGFLSVIYSGGANTFHREIIFAGYTGENGLVSEYCLIVSALSYYLVLSTKNLNHKLLYQGILVLALIIGFTTASKTFLVLVFLFVMLAMYLSRFTNQIKSRSRIIALAFLVAFFGSLVYFSADLYMMERIEQQINRTESVGRSDYFLDNVIHRPYLEQTSEYLSESGLFGIGPINALGINGNSFATHSLYIDLLMKYGIIGLIVYLFFYFSILRKTFRLIKVPQSDAFNKQLIIILFSLFSVLLIGEYARSHQNQTSHLLIFWFLIGLMTKITYQPSVLLSSVKPISKTK